MTRATVAAINAGIVNEGPALVIFAWLAELRRDLARACPPEHRARFVADWPRFVDRLLLQRLAEYAPRSCVAIELCNN
jgi:hypothetical protein